MTEERPYPYKIYSPEGYINSLKIKHGTAYGLLGNNELNTAPISDYTKGKITLTELEIALSFEEDLLKLLMVEMTEEQRIEYAFSRDRIFKGVLDHSMDAFIRDSADFEDKYKRGEIAFSDEELMEMYRVIRKRNIAEATRRRDKILNP